MEVGLQQAPVAVVGCVDGGGDFVPCHPGLWRVCGERLFVALFYYSIQSFAVASTQYFVDVGVPCLLQ